MFIFSIEPLIGGLRHSHFQLYRIMKQKYYWTPYRGIETLEIHWVWEYPNYWTPYRGIETESPFLRILLYCIAIEPLIGGLRHITRSAQWYEEWIYWTPYRGIDTFFILVEEFEKFSIEPLIGGLKCSFAFLERGAVEELFTGLECGEWRVELKTFLTQTNISRFFQ